MSRPRPFLWILKLRERSLAAQLADKEDLIEDHQRRIAMLHDHLRRVRSAIATREDPRKLLRNGASR